MKKIITILSIVFISVSTTNAQFSYDFGLQLGGAIYAGEVGGNGTEASPFILDAKLTHMRHAVGGYFRYNFSSLFSARLNVGYIRIAAEDSTSQILTQRARNLHFRTEIYEASLVGQFDFFTLANLSRSSNARIDFRTYVFGGVGAALYYPHAEYQDKWYSLRPLQTEGTENAYDEMTIIIPFGAGANFTFDRKFRIGVEGGYRFTFTDYLDDVSTDYAFDSELPFEESKIFANRTASAYASGAVTQEELSSEFFKSGSIRGNPETDDGYLTIQITVGYVIQKNNFYKAKYNSIINRRRKRTKF